MGPIPFSSSVEMRQFVQIIMFFGGGIALAVVGWAVVSWFVMWLSGFTMLLAEALATTISYQRRKLRSFGIVDSGLMLVPVVILAMFFVLVMAVFGLLRWGFAPPYEGTHHHGEISPDLHSHVSTGTHDHKL